MDNSKRLHKVNHSVKQSDRIIAMAKSIIIILGTIWRKGYRS